MPWGRCDDGYYRHEKVASLRDAVRLQCVGLYWLAISWCNDQLTDGRVPLAMVRLLGSTKGHAVELVRVGLWEATDAGYAVHDYLQFNKSKAQVLQERTEANERKAAERARRESRSESQAMSQRDSGGDSASESLARPVSRSPSPVPRLPKPPPVPRTRAQDEATAIANGEPHDDFDDALGWLARHHAYPGSGTQIDLARLVDKHGGTQVIATMSSLVPQTDAAQYVYGARNILNPIPKGAPEPDQAYVNEQIAARRKERAHA